MTNYWAMKTFKDWAEEFITRKEIGLDEEGVDADYLGYDKSSLPLDNTRILRRFDQFCKWASVGDYVLVGTGQTTKFNAKLVGVITGDYHFDASRQSYRHIRKIEVLKVYDEPVEIEKWGQIQRIELVGHQDFIETLIEC
ncbi:hypothetical protein [Lysinibacillus odysseyi]|uniref:Uncharacterized protein n=1 Tax=Lysinibacillus odysseyi 34hs-1 = NBRC 100172 TaxID=1220589 RepID=A0A0A3ITK7_9BACI|nr:hypothetical protein [Lysinibacillus odysseyi]KGR88056.1 hypothetical protein CD32_02205 [Lysinibacillus odysseyi 34hs-1 = NBRC 100172]